MTFKLVKNSNIDWIGLIPTTWEVRRVKHGFYRKDAKANQENPVVLSLARSGVKVRDISNNEGQLAESYTDYNPVEPGDLLLNPMDLYSGANCSISNVSGVISPAYMNLKSLPGYDPRFYDYYFKTQYWGMAMFAHGKGVSFDNRWTMNRETLMNYYIPYPMYSEQVKIANFLDKKVSEIDNAIEKTKQSIEEYKKLKQAIITEAVTKGLNPDVEMKDSGIEALGKVPNSWKITRTKFIATSFVKGNGITKDEVDGNGDISCVRYGEIYSKYNGEFTTCVSKTNLSNQKAPQFVEKGNILFACTGELVEEIGKNVVYMGNIPVLAGGDIIVMKHEQNPMFLNYLLNSEASQIQKSKGKTKLKVVHISASEIGNVIVALPPIDEQIVIADYLTKRCRGIDSIIEIKDKLIFEFQTYKKSLIYECVTGKKEVV